MFKYIKKLFSKQTNPGPLTEHFAIPYISLEQAINNKNADDVEGAIYHLYKEKLDFTPEIIDQMIWLLTEEWHFRHEDVVSYLQKAKSPSAIQSLKNSATKKFEYLEADNSLAFARKCVWSINDIGTPEAKEALISLSKCGESEIEGFALKRLSKWGENSSRKSV